MRAQIVAAVIATGLTAAVAVALVAAGDNVRRPEGAAERYLQALSNDHDPDPWGDPDLAAALIDFSANDDTLFSTIEVGRASEAGEAVTVPARVVRNDGDNSEIHLAITARRASTEPHDWRIVAIDQVATASVPSEGGTRPSRASTLLWPAAGLVAVALASGADLVVSQLRRRRSRRGQAAVTEIDFTELRAKLDAGAIVLIDAQAPGWYDQEHLPGAEPIDWHQITASAARLIPAPDSEVAVYCWNTTCTGSEVIADQLVKLGYQRVRRYTGGKQDWVDHGGPLDSTPAPT